MKLYNVAITALCNVAIFAESEDEALTGACENVAFGDFELSNGGPAELIEDDEEEGELRESHIRHADVCLDSKWRHIRRTDAIALLGDSE